MRLKHRDMMVDFCFHHLGVPYIWGGDDPIDGYDCSGFAQEFLLAFGAHPKPGSDFTAQGLYDYFIKNGAYNTKSVGAMAFYGKSYNSISHVAVVISNDLVFEFGGGGSRTKDEEDASLHNAYGRVRPLESRSDLISCILPKYP